jgi:autotransporter-associated beta strand protein
LSSGISNLDAVTQTISLAGLNLAKPEVFFGAIGDLVINSPVSGSGTLVKTLSGKVILGGDNSYTGGTEIRAGTLEITSATNLGSGAITLAGGTLSVNNSAVISLANDILVTAPSTLQIAQGTTVLSGSISGDARLTLAGAGLLQVALNAEAFTGVIDVQSARVQLSATRYVPVEVHGGEADLEGDLLDVQVFNGGTVDVVDPLATGSLHTLDLKINAGGRLALELGGTNAGASIDGYDQLKVDGTITLGGSLAITQLAGFSPAVGQKFFLLENDGNDPINGAFSNAPDGGIFSMGGVSFMVSYAGDSATGGTSGGNDLVLTVVPQVPESWSSSLGGVGVLLLLRRRRAAATRSVRRGLS